MSLGWMGVIVGVAFAQDPEPGVEFEMARDGELTGEVLAILGPRHSGGANNGRIELGSSLNAEFGARMDCGAVRFEGDFNAILPDISEVPQQLQANALNLLSAVPMLTLCHVSPSLCAEMKNLNFRIDEEWDFSADICKAMDTYIDDQAELGEREARNRYKRECVARETDAGTDPAVAVHICETAEPENGYLVVDEAQGFLTRTFTDAPQQAVRGALTATQSTLSQNEEFYEMLVALGGEMEIRHNGTVMPLFPEMGNLLAEELAEDMKDRSVRTSCVLPLRDLFGTINEQGFLEPGEMPQSGAVGPDPSTRYWTKEMYSIFTTEFTQRDADNLYTLDTKVFWSMCKHLGEVVTAETIVRLEKQIESELALMEANPALSDPTRRKLKEIKRAVEALRKQMDEEVLPSIPEYRLQLEQMADAIRAERRGIAGALSAGEAREEVMKDRWLNCTSYATCGGN